MAIDKCSYRYSKLMPTEDDIGWDLKSGKNRNSTTVPQQKSPRII